MPTPVPPAGGVVAGQRAAWGGTTRWRETKCSNPTRVPGGGDGGGGEDGRGGSAEHAHTPPATLTQRTPRLARRRASPRSVTWRGPEDSAPDPQGLFRVSPAAAAGC